jgi:hypothetical protein
MMSEADNIDYILQLAQRAVSATSGKEYITALEEAHLSLNWQEWTHFNAEYRRLKDESDQRRAANSAERDEYNHSLAKARRG